MCYDITRLLTASNVTLKQTETTTCYGIIKRENTTIKIYQRHRLKKRHHHHHHHHQSKIHLTEQTLV